MKKSFIKKRFEYIESNINKLEESKEPRNIELWGILKTIPLISCVALIYLLFEKEFVSCLDRYVMPLFANMSFHFFTHVFLGILILLVIWCFHKCYNNRYFVPWNIIMLSILGITIYIEYRVKYYESLPWGWVGYSDILVILLGFFLICMVKIRITKKEDKTEDQSEDQLEFIFIPDTAIKEKKTDELEYSDVIKKFAKNIAAIKKEEAFSIGLVAPWGHGKTSFLNLLQEELEEMNKFIIIKFNPRHSRGTSNIQEDFFNMLFSELKKYDFRFSYSFKSYLKAIDIINENKLITFLFNTHKIWDKELEKKKIDTAISRLSQRIIVIIEDFDRLLQEEIIEVLKLIDGNASFTNLIFLTAYDRNYINNTINKTSSNEEIYFVEKFFDLELSLPLRPYRNIFYYLINELAKGLQASPKERKAYISILGDYMKLLENHLSTLRDVKRFLNLLLCQYIHAKEFVEFKDYFFLYLIKYKYPDEYLHLFNKKYISKNENRYTLNDTLEKVKSKEILEVLFPKNVESTDRSISNEFAFKSYFYEMAYASFAIKEVEEMFFSDFYEVKKYIDEAPKNTIREIIDYLDVKNVLLLFKKEQFERYLDILLYLNCCIDEMDNTTPFLKWFAYLYIDNSKQLQKIYLYSETEYKEMISEKMQGKYPDYPSILTRATIRGIIYRDFAGDIIFNQKEVLEIACKALDDLIEHDKIVKQKHLELLYSCIDDVDRVSTKSVLNKKACVKIRSLVIKNPSEYFKNFVRIVLDNTTIKLNSITCEPYYEQIFKDIDDLKNIIDIKAESIPNITLILNFLRLYENNNYQPIKFHSQEIAESKMENNLKEEVHQLEELVIIEEKFSEYNLKVTNHSSQDTSDTLKFYDGLLSQIKSIPLSLTKKQKIVNEILNARNNICHANGSRFAQESI